MKDYPSCPHSPRARGLQALTGVVLFALKTALWQSLVQGHRTQKRLVE